jgi:two-component system, chemotaxis family, chemotaxis protein CheY
VVKKILIADDSNTLKKLLSVYLLDYYGEDNIDIIKAEDGAEALFAIRDNKDLELIFLDMMMPIVDGYSVAEYLFTRKLEIETVIISANLDKTMVSSLAKIGFKQFLPKPIHNDRLVTILDALKKDSDEASE